MALAISGSVASCALLGPLRCSSCALSQLEQDGSVPALNTGSLRSPQTLPSLLILAAGQGSCVNVLGYRLLGTHCCIWIFGLRDKIINFSGLQTRQF